jgi:hypothetical protein
MSQPEFRTPSIAAPTLTVPQRRVFLDSSSVDLQDWRSRIDELLPYLWRFSSFLCLCYLSGRKLSLLRRFRRKESEAWQSFVGTLTRQTVSSR